MNSPNVNSTGYAPSLFSTPITSAESYFYETSSGQHIQAEIIQPELITSAEIPQDQTGDKDNHQSK